MPSSKKIRESAKRDIAAALARYGDGYDHTKLWKRKYPSVTQPTWYRWVEAVRKSGAPARKAARRVKRKAAERAKKPNAKDSAIADIKDQLPEILRPEDIAGTPLIKVTDRIRECVNHADEVLSHCRADDGRLKNPVLYMKASRHILEAMKVSSQVTNQLMEATRLEAFHQAILNRLRTRDPQLVEEILQDLEQLNRSWGVV